MRRIKVLGITGGVGAGKSTVLAWLKKKYGAEVLQLDEAAHILMEPGGSCFAPVVRAFGGEIARDGRIDRRLLYQKAFVDADRVAELNSIVHPRVKAYVREWIARKQEEGEAPFLVLEAALLLEEHYNEICDEIWYIRVDDETRIARLTASRGYTREKTLQILREQKSDAEFLQACDYVIDNSGNDLENTYGQIDRGIREHEFM